MSERTVAQLLAQSRAQIAHGDNDALAEARMLLAHAAGLPRDRLFELTSERLDAPLIARYHALLARRAAREPMSHILGRRAFWTSDFIVTPDVLDPRPDTETLVAAALEVPFDRLLDLGTGSGAILLSLLKERPQARAEGTDLSEPALQVARRNAQALGVARRAQLYRSDWFDAVRGHFDLITSNPPYIAQDEMAALAPELAHEPRMALTDGADGLTAYRAITAGAGDHLAPRGWLMVEIGPTQGALVLAMFQHAGLVNCAVRQDLDHRDRVVIGQKQA